MCSSNSKASTLFFTCSCCFWSVCFVLFFDFRLFFCVCVSMCVSIYFFYLHVSLHVSVSCLLVCLFSFPGLLQGRNKSTPCGGSKTSLRVENSKSQCHNNREQVTLQETLPAGREPAQGVSPLSYSNSCRCRANNKLVNLLRERKLAKIMTQKNSSQKKFREEVDS